MLVTVVTMGEVVGAERVWGVDDVCGYKELCNKLKFKLVKN